MCKKLMCVFLSILLAAMLPLYAAGAEGEAIPVVIVSGTNNYPLVDADSGEQVFPMNGDAVKAMVVKAIVPALSALLFGTWDKLADAVLPQARDLLEKLKCDADGSSLYNITTRTFPESMAFYPEKLEGTRTHEDALCREAASRIGAQNVYVFSYDWRLSPMELADELAIFVEKVRGETGSEKVSIAAISLGGAQVMAYLSKYEPDCIHSVSFLSSTFTGAKFPGDLFTKDVQINEADVYRLLVNNVLTDEGQKKMITGLFAVLDMSGLAGCLFRRLEKGIGQILDRVYDELLGEIFRYVPAFWALLDDERYEQAKDMMLPDASDAFIEKIDAYHYGVLCRSREILDSARARGTYLYVTSNYNRGTYPLYASAAVHTDGLLDTHSTSGGALCAKPFETLAPELIPENRVCTDDTHSHRSADGFIDASTCLLPEQTWLIKNLTHVGCARDTDFTGFVITLSQSQTLISVDTFAEFPQFLLADDSYGVAPLTPENAQDRIPKLVYFLNEHFWSR